MSLAGVPETSVPASILVVDDDRRVVELLTIALNAYGFRVLQATDGEEALRVVTRERPDLVVLDVRLPKRSGYEVCEVLRQDPEDPQLPIIMVSAAAETEARLQGLSRGADDYVAKPFSPKELIARIRRLLARSTESREARRKSREAEHQLGQAREEARRSHAELRDQQRLRDLADGFARDFHASLDEGALTRRLLIETQAQLGTGMVALLQAEESEGALRPTAVRGDVAGRVEALRLDRHGELLALLAGLGRPVRRRDLDRFPEMQRELSAFVAAGVAVLAPLRGPDGLVGVVVSDERIDGGELDGPRLEAMDLLCHTASLALRNASRSSRQAEALLEVLDELADRAMDPRSAACDEAILRLQTCAASLPPSVRREVERAVRIAPWSAGEQGSRALATMAERDASGRVARFARLTAIVRDAGAVCVGDGEPYFDASVAIARWALAYIEHRAGGLAPDVAHERALTVSEHQALDPLRAPAPRSRRATSSPRSH